jgi:hypothetical protein
VVPMSGPDFEAKCINSSDIITILAAEGVQFLLSGEGKVIQSFPPPPPFFSFLFSFFLFLFFYFLFFLHFSTRNFKS